ncbi:M43 family zinc metalloprotease [Dinghuibacter silviterrae]|uniref:Gliding motility-associated-like protein n=1 Tax=Dinghuibacter silviterrae TaxID=1539049 RepID=A0A4R8DNE1_9BACT|nr:M43 family zinc metalloprotease [Dinghuibacter silviterrae]TDW99225.1 gliding motility-associated-like protein [Dinghuibacter silviterrae]
MKSNTFRLYSLLICCMLALTARGQVPSYMHPISASYFASTCGTEQRMRNGRLDATFRLQEQRINEQILKAEEKEPALVDYTLPVVFHIVGTNPSAVTDAQIVAAVQDLNDAFAHTGVYATGPGANTHIHFCLAQTDPLGGNTTGITRTTSFLGDEEADMEDDKVKGLVDWDPTHYVNIWVVSTLKKEDIALFQCGAWVRMNEGGYATMPPSAGSTLDGIVVTGFGKLLAHEMGHYLGLYHTFQGMDCKNNNCATDGDMVCDTPPQRDIFSSPACNRPVNSCSTDTLSGFTTDVPDLISNFMSYGNAPCINEFTQGQAVRMQATIATVRSSLLQNECTPACTEGSIASFTRDLPYPNPGNTVNFTNTSTGATQYQWSVNGAVVSTGTNFSYTVPASGTYTVSLKAFNANPSCYASYTDNVIVSCGTMARFYADKQAIASKNPIYLDSIQFTNRSVNGVTYQWLLNDSVVSTAPNLTYTFNTPGTDTMRLVATNGSCVDTTEGFIIPVADPTPDAVLTLENVHCYDEDSLQASVVVCNEGYAPLPKGIPVTFYDADPSTPTAHILGKPFFVPGTILGNCCDIAYKVTLAAGQIGLNQLYAVINDSSTKVPLVMPNTPILESNYTNNESSISGFQFSAAITPADTEVIRKSSYLLNIVGSDQETFTAVWAPGPQYNLSCLNCLTPSVQVFGKSMVRVRVTTQYGCTVSDSVPVMILPPDFTMTIDTTQCYNKDSVMVAFTVCMNNGYDSLWAGIPVAFQSGPVFVTPALVGTPCVSYHLIVPFPGGDSLRASVNGQDSIPETDFTNNGASVAVTPFSLVLVPSDTSVPTGATLQMTALVSGGAPGLASWTPGENLSCTGCLEPLLTAPYTQQYRVVVRNQYYCIDTAYALIKTYTGGEVNIPGAFTPNGDGRNDIFFIMGGKDVQSIRHLAIFDRYGKPVFESSNALPNDPSLGWDGTAHGQPAAPGAYVYMALITFTEGRQQLYKGTLVLIR